MGQLRVRKRIGMEDEELLGDLQASDSTKENSNPSGLVASVTSFFSGKGSEEDASSLKPSKSSKDSTIHVFSLATGLLYERLLRIMMLSVVKRASAPVKFWLLGNFLSPEFKKVVPKMAQKYGFEVAFITYKWPEWLRRQTEKQRIIWGYKILFLDVLFPLDIKRIIYVDADQVVRADLKELWDMDIQGTRMPTLLFAPRAKKHWDINFGIKDTGKTTCRENLIISVLFIWSIS